MGPSKMACARAVPNHATQLPQAPPVRPRCPSDGPVTFFSETAGCDRACGEPKGAGLATLSPPASGRRACSKPRGPLHLPPDCDSQLELSLLLLPDSESVGIGWEGFCGELGAAEDAPFQHLGHLSETESSHSCQAPGLRPKAQPHSVFQVACSCSMPGIGALHQCTLPPLPVALTKAGRAGADDARLVKPGRR